MSKATMRLFLCYYEGKQYGAPKTVKQMAKLNAAVIGLEWKAL